MHTARIVRTSLSALAMLLVGVLAHAEPKHVYLTYSGAPETTIDINVILPTRQPEVTIHYDTQPRGGRAEDYARRTTATYTQTIMELSDRRALYVGVLSDLQPATTYYFVTGEETHGLSRERSFRTLPGGDGSFRILNGGDMGVTGAVVPLMQLAGRQDPDFAVLGGDLAYVNGLLAGNETWDRWLSQWDEHMVTTDGRMIPIVTAVGNHETNQFRSDDHTLRSPWYTSLFGRQGTDIHHVKRFGNNLALFLLDSGHLVSHEAQVPWLRRAFEEHKDVRYTFAAYHVPLYPAYRPYDGSGSRAGREHWLPVFDEFGLTVGLEHHDHVFKRTKPMKGNQVAEQGTIYIGDGAFGRPARTTDPETRWYNAAEKAIVHFWVIDVASTGLRFKAIDDTGTTVDEFSLPPPDATGGRRGPSPSALRP
jgi:acid phosphatase type 7